MESISVFLVDWVSGKVLEAAAGRLSSEPSQLDRIERRLARIDAKLDAQLAGHLRAAITLLRLEKEDPAVHELALAEAVQPSAPMPKVLLAAVAQRLGKTDLAREKLRAALTLNPFVLLGLALEAPAELPPLLPAAPERPAGRAWSIPLYDEDADRLTPGTLVTGSSDPVAESFVGGGSMVSIQRSIRFVATGGSAFDDSGHVAVVWRDDAQRRGAEYYDELNRLTLFALEDGRPLWSRSLSKDGRRLVPLLVTPSFVAVRAHDGSGPFELWSAADGSHLATHELAEFELLVCPEFETVTETEPYRRSHRYMRDIAAVWDELTERGLAQESSPWEFEDSDAIAVSGPFESTAYELTASNRWRLRGSFRGGLTGTLTKSIAPLVSVSDDLRRSMLIGNEWMYVTSTLERTG